MTKAAYKSVSCFVSKAVKAKAKHLNISYFFLTGFSLCGNLKPEASCFYFERT